MTLYQNILMWVSLAAAFALAAAGVVVWCDLREVLPGRRILHAFLRLPWLVRLFLVVFVVQLVVHGSTKTNATNGVDGGTTNSPTMMGAVLGGARGRTPNGVVQPEAGRVPTGAALAQNLWRRGCWEDWLLVSFEDGWVFPYGTNHLSRVAVITQGELRTGVRDTDAIASLGAKVAHVPFDTCFYHELTPSNTYRFVWDRAYVDRNTNMPMCAVIELFRNGDTCVTTNGVAAFTPREIPFPHIGIGQNDDWVRTNFVNAAEILAVGYANWVNDQVGVDHENGLYKFTATFIEDPHEATLLTVGDLSVCVTNAGEYVFLLEKGVEYTFGTEPYDATVEYSMQDDVGPDAEIVYPAFSIFNSPFPIFSWWRDDPAGEWTVDGGWKWIWAPTVWGFGYLSWAPKFHASPNVTHLGVNDFPMTFEAVLVDCCRTNGVTYQWSTSTEGVHIVSPNSRMTEVTVDALPSWAEFSMTVKAYLADDELTSTITTAYGTNAAPQVSFSLSIPDVMFVNNDDDDGDGIDDCLHVTLDDDDIVSGAVTFHSDAKTNATIKIESISGFDAGLYDNISDFVFTDWNCTNPIREGDRFAIVEDTDLVVPLYVNPMCRSVEYEDVEIVASVTLEGGERRELTAKATIINPVVEPICNEMTRIVEGVTTNEVVCNPCGVAIGRMACFRVGVTPDDFPDEKIVWSVDGGLEFVGGNVGREVQVRGTSAGEAKLSIHMREAILDMPSFSVNVVSETTVGIRAMIVSKDGAAVQTAEEIAKMITVVNNIYSQVGMAFYLSSVCVTNLPSAYEITEEETGNGCWWHDRLTALMPVAPEIECYFVNDIVDAEGESLGVFGVTSDGGIVLTAMARGETLAHEIGHLCDARDVYDSDSRGGLPMTGYRISSEHSPCDWNGGCLGRGSPGSRYYPYGMNMKEIISRLLMNGRRKDGDRHVDMTIGSVYGVRKTSQTTYERADVDIGFFGLNGVKTPQTR